MYSKDFRDLIFVIPNSWEMTSFSLSSRSFKSDDGLTLIISFISNNDGKISFEEMEKSFVKSIEKEMSLIKYGKKDYYDLEISYYDSKLNLENGEVYLSYYLLNHKDGFYFIQMVDPLKDGSIDWYKNQFWKSLRLRDGFIKKYKKNSLLNDDFITCDDGAFICNSYKIKANDLFSFAYKDFKDICIYCNNKIKIFLGGFLNKDGASYVSIFIKLYEIKRCKVFLDVAVDDNSKNWFSIDSGNWKIPNFWHEYFFKLEDFNFYQKHIVDFDIAISDIENKLEYKKGNFRVEYDPTSKQLF